MGFFFKKKKINPNPRKLSSIKVTEPPLWLDEKWLRFNIHHRQSFSISYKRFCKHIIYHPSISIFHWNALKKIYKQTTRPLRFKHFPTVPLHNANNLCFALKPILILAVCLLLPILIKLCCWNGYFEADEYTDF